MCNGYCHQSINVTLDSNELIALKESNYVQNAYPSVQKKFRFSSSEWKELINLIHSEDFKLLDDRIGCPDCADGGAEWIIVHWSQGQIKRVTFEYGKSIQGFHELVIKLRDLRNRYLNNL